jgi:DNA sulfur modification protein DndD
LPKAVTTRHPQPAKKELETKEVDYKVDLKKVMNDNDDLIADLESIKAEKKRLHAASEQGELIKDQMEAVDNVAAALSEILGILKEDVRRSLADQINEVWKDSAVKEYTAEVNENYQLTLYKTIKGEAYPVSGASTGEKLVLAMSFVGSLIKKAAENLHVYESQESPEVVVGGAYPLVMDSGFGSLEDDYREAVAEWIPKLADQIIIMVSKSQWRIELEEGMKNKIGKEYIFELHTPKQNIDRTIELSGKEFHYVLTSSEAFEQTYIKEAN